MSQQATVSSIPEGAMSSASSAPSACLPAALKMTFNTTIMLSGDTVQELIKGSSSRAKNQEDETQQPEIRHLTTLLDCQTIGDSPERRGPTDHPPPRTGDRTPDTGEDSIDIPRPWPRPPPPRLDRCKHPGPGNLQVYIPVQPYVLVEQNDKQQFFLLDMPLYIFRIWLCVLSSCLNQSIQRLPTDEKTALVYTYSNLMTKVVDAIRWTQPAPDQPKTPYPLIEPVIPLPRNMRPADIASDLVSIFDACFAGSWYFATQAHALFIFVHHGGRNAAEDNNELTRKQLYHYNQQAGDSEEAIVLPLWKDNNWGKWKRVSLNPPLCSPSKKKERTITNC